MLARAVLPPHTDQLALSDIFDTTVNLAAHTLHTRLTVISRIDGSTSTVVAVADQLNEVRTGTMFPLSDSFCLQVLPHGRPLIVSDLTQASAALQRIPGALELDLRSYLGVPLMLDADTAYGTLWVADSDVRAFTAGEVSSLTTLAYLLQHEIKADVGQRQAERSQALNMLEPPVEPLTGLMGREAFTQYLTVEERRRARYGGQYSLVTLHLRGLDVIIGHDRDLVAQRVQRGLADLLMRSTRIVDCCTYLDAQTFGVLLPQTSRTDAQKWQQRIIAAIQTWNTLNSASVHPMVVDMSIRDSTQDTGTALLDAVLSELAA